MLFTRALILSTLTLLTTAQTPNNAAPAVPTTLNGAQVNPPLHSPPLPPTPILHPQANPPPPSKETRAVNDLLAYQSSLLQQPEYTSVLAALQSAIPPDVLEDIEDDPSGYLQSIITETARPSWYSAIPTSYQNYLSSVGVAEASIVSKDATGPAPTRAPGAKVVGAALAVGAAGLAML